MNQLRAAPPTHDFAKACVVVSGPTLVTLVPMAAAPALGAMAARFAGTFGGDGALFAQLVMTIPAIMLVLSAPVLGWLCERIGRRRWSFRCCGSFRCLRRCRHTEADDRRTNNDPEKTMPAHVKHVRYF